jgi:hypothetical protein
MTITDARGKSSSGPGAGSERYSQKGKQRKAEEDKIWDHPKSKATLKLEGLLGDLKKMQDGEGGKVARSKEGSEQDCFCQGESTSWSGGGDVRQAGAEQVLYRI